MKSIMQSAVECYLCENIQNLEKHHAFGGALRKKSEQYGLWVYLDHDHHNENKRGDPGVHFCRELDLRIKMDAQRAFEREHPDLVFMDIFGRNYL